MRPIRSSRWPPTSSARSRPPAPPPPSRHVRRTRRPDHAGRHLDGYGQPGQVARRRHRALAHDGRHRDRRSHRPARAAQARWSRSTERQPGQVAAPTSSAATAAGTATADHASARDAVSCQRSPTIDQRSLLDRPATATAEVASTSRRARSADHAGHRVERCRRARQVARDRCRTHADRGRRRTAASILGSAREAQTSFATTSRRRRRADQGDLADIERSLNAVTANTAETIQASALAAQTALVSASNEVSAKVKSTSADIERTMFAASGSFGTTITGKTDEIVTYVQQQTDRLARSIDSQARLAGRGDRQPRPTSSPPTSTASPPTR